MRLGVVDVETTPISPGRTPRTRLWGVKIEHSGYHQFRTTRELVDFLSRQTDIRLYNHHDFDPTQCIVDRVIPEKIKMRGARIIRCHIGGHEWINSFALFPDKLAKILEACGYEKKSLTATGHPLGCECGACFAALQDRNESDCSDALTSFLSLGEQYAKECGIDPMRDGFATAASAAFAAAEKVAGPLPIELRYRESYRGGRTEAFRLGVLGEADCYDINSSYPYSFLDLPEIDHLCKIEVTMHRDFSGPMPFFMENDRSDGLLFPSGRFKTWVFASNYERYILPHGGIKSVRQIETRRIDLTWLKRVAPMIERVYAKRQISGEGVKYALKIFLNSLYGRLGMRPYKQVCGRGAVLPKHVDSSYFRIGLKDFLYFHEVYGKPKANYPLAAAITCNARARLYDAMRRLGDAVYYVDTDGLYLKAGTEFPYETHPTKLGAWKKEKTGKLTVRTVKDYEHAGIDKKGKPFHDNKRKGGATSTVWTVKLALGGNPVRRVDKSRKSTYDKRRVLRGGFTAPLVY